MCVFVWWFRYAEECGLNSLCKIYGDKELFSAAFEKIISVVTIPIRFIPSKLIRLLVLHMLREQTDIVCK